MRMNGHSKTAVGLIVGIIIGAVGAVFATNPKTREAVKNVGNKAVGHAKGHVKTFRERVRGKHNDNPM